jgi:thiamine pyrophosphate-dependent acetolactate synthase large subunit-like protein
MENLQSGRAEIKDPSAVPEMVRKAFKVAQTERPGSCYLGILQDIEERSILPTLQPLVPSQVYDSAPSPSQVSRPAKVLEAANSPIVLRILGTSHCRHLAIVTDLIPEAHHKQSSQIKKCLNTF